jgi:hypothetical protein
MPSELGDLIKSFLNVDMNKITVISLPDRFLHTHRQRLQKTEEKSEYQQMQEGPTDC